MPGFPQFLSTSPRPRRPGFATSATAGRPFAAGGRARASSISTPGGEGSPIRTSSGASARSSFRRPGPTSGSARPPRAHPGDGARRQRTKAIPLPCRLPRGPGGGEIRAHAAVRQGAAGDPRDGRGAHESPRPAARESARDRRAPARDDPDPRRQRRIRQGQPELRPHHPEGRSTSRSRGRRSGFSSRARAASNGRLRCATAVSRGSSGPARSCRDRSFCNISTRTKSCAPSPPATSTTI